VRIGGKSSVIFLLCGLELQPKLQLAAFDSGKITPRSGWMNVFEFGKQHHALLLIRVGAGDHGHYRIGPAVMVGWWGTSAGM
jgi:hypothetical protein